MSPMDDREVYELINSMGSGLHASISDMRVQLQEVATRLDERHVATEARLGKLAEDVDGAFSRIRKMEGEQSKSSVVVTLITTAVSGILAAAAIKLVVG